ncbi:DUF6907 domain-containing protein [Streptomyces tremellae]|uniref:Uncharacterized protein n=1 Tax=Streptomyces tremellae TaxID=1124239 RepID=A0ABP7EZU1_9ACTN
MSGQRTVTVHTLDHGPVTLTCPTWCTGEHEQGGYRADIEHIGPARLCTWRGYDIAIAELAQAPYGTLSHIRASVDIGDMSKALEPDELRQLGAELIRYASELHALAAQLTDLRTRGGTR